MRITIWGINYAPEVTGIAPFNRGMCRYLAAQGHEVRMVSAFAYYPAWRKADKDRARLYRTEVVDGITVHRCWHYVPARPTAVRRMVHELSFGLVSLGRLLVLPRSDLYMVVSPPLILGPLARVLCWLKRSRYIFHVQDLQPDAAVGLGLINQQGLLTRTLHAAAKLAYRNAAMVSGISHAMMQAFAEKGVAEERCYWFPNWVEGLEPVGGSGGTDVEELATAGAATRGNAWGDIGHHPRYERRGEVQEQGATGLQGSAPNGAARALARRWRQFHGVPQNAFLASYSGNLGRKQGLSTLIDAAERLAAEKAPGAVYLVIAGDGAMRATLEQRLQHRRVPNLRLLPLLPEADYRRMLDASNICLIVQARGTGRFFLPSKLLTILAAGRPVLAAADDTSELAVAVRQGGFGVVVPPDHPEALAGALVDLSLGSAELAEYGRRGRKWVEQFDADRVLGRFEARLRQLKPGASARRAEAYGAIEEPARQPQNA